jgi:hypothetical protein
MSLFNEDIDTAIALHMAQAHLRMLIEIKEQRIPEGYHTYLDLLIQQEIKKYLDDFGGELDASMDANSDYLKDVKHFTNLELKS